jgi:SpoU rRNA methylase family enzyme
MSLRLVDLCLQCSIFPVTHRALQSSRRVERKVDLGALIKDKVVFVFDDLAIHRTRRELSFRSLLSLVRLEVGGELGVPLVP